MSVEVDLFVHKAHGIILKEVTLINDVSGGGFVHKAHGIILKEVTHDTSVTA